MGCDPPYTPHILLAWNFDSTSATDSTKAILEVYGRARSEYEQGFVEPLGAKWDNVIRRGQALIDFGRSRGRLLSHKIMEEAVGRASLCPDVLEMPARLTQVSREVHRETKPRLVVLSSGDVEFLDATPIAR